MRALAPLAVVALTAACSGGSADESPTTTAPEVDADGAEPAPSDEAPSSTSDGAAPSDDGAAAAELAAASEVSVVVSAPGLGIDAALAAESAVAADPFGDFVSCSGTRAEVGTYVVTFARTSGDPLALSLLSAVPVTGPGTVDADVRVERPVGDPVVATGTMTLDAGLQAGTFIAFSAAGDRIEGSFRCDSPSQPQPLAERSGGSVEIVALLRQGDAERVVALATSDPAFASCPGDVAGQPLVVRADGGPELGSLSTFALTVDGSAGDDAALRIGIGDRVEVFDDVSVVLDDDRSAGTFSGVAGRLAIDGAFTCE